MRRRTACRLGLAGAAWLLGGGHTPYGQWQVYRRRHLMIGTSRADAPTYPLGQRIAETLASHLPESSARVTRGPDAWRLASLITSGQLEVILLSTAHVAALRDGRPPFEAFGATRLCSLFMFDGQEGGHWLVCRPDFPDRHAYLVVETLAVHAAPLLGGRAPDLTSPVPLHPGALAYLRGAPLPPPTPTPDLTATAG
jgi:hypothetical protein